VILFRVFLNTTQIKPCCWLVSYRWFRSARQVYKKR